jgi:hypothetical protein
MFDLSKFNHAIEHFRRLSHDSPDGSMMLNEGLRLVLESRKRTAPNQMRIDIASILDRNILLEPMFPGADEQAPGLFFDLARFMLLTIPECAYEAVGNQAYDLAYHLREKLHLRSAEPDVPFERYEPPTSKQASGCREPEGGEPPDYAWSLRTMKVPLAWGLTPPPAGASKGKGIRIGHPDTGYADHVDLDSTRLDLTSGYDFVDKKPDPQDPLDYSGKLLSPGHGTATGSVIVSEGGVLPAPVGGATGGTSPPGRITGVAPAATLVPIRAIQSVIRIFSGTVARAVYRATQKDCHVISMSLGGAPSRALHAAIEYAIGKNVIVLAAAGNCVGFVVWPARYRGCIALAATNIADLPWKGSSHGSAVAVSAPGEYVWCARRKTSTDPVHDLIDGGQGTSFAAANAAGVAALWLAFHDRNVLIDACTRKGASLQETFKSLLRSTARVPPNNWDDKEYGSGIIDAETLLKAQITPDWNSLAYEDYRYIGHISSVLDLPLSERVLQLVRTLFPNAKSSLGGLVWEMEWWGHEVLNVLIKDDALREEMRMLLLRDWDSRQTDYQSCANFIKRIGAQSSSTLKAIFASE